MKHYVCELYRQGQFPEALRACDLTRPSDEVTNLDVVRVLLLAETGDGEGANAELERLARLPGDPMTTDMKAYLALVARTYPWSQ